MLTMALETMGGGGSKHETLRFIERRGWYVTCRSDSSRPKTAMNLDLKTPSLGHERTESATGF